MGMRGRDRVALAGCAAALFWSTLALGGATRWAALGGALLSLVAAAAFVTSRRVPTRWSPLLVLLAIATTLTALQLLPLPAPLARVLAHAKLDLVVDNARAWGESAPAFVTASYDPPATLLELVKLGGYAALAFAALRLAAQSSGRRLLAMAVVGAGLAVALVALVHAIVGATHIYGLVVSPTHASLLTPLINENHLASLMALAAPVALGLVVSSEGVRRLGFLAALAVCAGLALLSGSRGGAVGLVVALVVTIGLLLVQRRTRRERGSRDARASGVWIPMLIIGACAAILLGVVTAGRVISDLSRTTTAELHGTGSKYQEWGNALAMLRDHVWFGTGSGAFEPAFTRWSGIGATTFSHVENTYVQAAVDWGLPGAAALGLALAALVVAAARRWQHGPLEASALGALAGLAVHELADFSLALPAVAAVTVVLAAILVAPPLEARSISSLAPWRRPVVQRIAALAACGVLWIITATPVGRLAHADAHAIAGPAATRVGLALAASHRHPADYLVLGRGAQALAELDDPRAIPVLARALYLNPTHSDLHRYAAAMLLRANRSSQALSELALAVRYARPGTQPAIVQDAITAFPDPATAARAFPVEVAFAAQIVPVLLQTHHDAVAYEYARRVAVVAPDDPDAQLLAARAALAAAHPAPAVAAARDAHRLRPSADTAVVLAQALVLAGTPTEALTLLQESRAVHLARTPTEQVQLLEALATLQITAADFDAALATLDEILTIAPTRQVRVSVHAQRAALFDRRGNPNQAAYERDQAQQLSREP